jgi:cytoskeletal protein RodZ
MTDQPGGSLNAAYEAIKAKDLSKARDLLSAYLIDHPNDVDAWWLYSYAVTDVEQARKALETVLRLDPAYPGARDLLNELEAAAPGAPAPASTQEAPGIRPLAGRTPEIPLTTTVGPDDSPDESAEFGFPDEPAREPGGVSRVLIGTLAAIIVFLIVAALLVLPNLNRQQTVGDSPTVGVPTESAVPDTSTEAPTDAATEEVTDTVATESPADDATATDESATDEPVTDTAPTDEPATQAASPIPEASAEPTTETVASDPMQPIYDALMDGYDYIPGTAGIETTELGETVTVSICAPPAQSELRALIPSAMTQLARASESMPAEAQAVAARFVNCTDNAELRRVALNMADAQAFAAGALTDDELRTRLIALN